MKKTRNWQLNISGNITAKTAGMKMYLIPEFQNCLKNFNFAGKQLFVATSKLEKFALKIIQHFEFDKYILQLKGADYGGAKATKATIISELMIAQQLVPSKEIVMVGDTVFDIEGGKENGLSTIAVGYGFGKEDELKAANPDYFVEDVEELYEILIS